MDFKNVFTTFQNLQNYKSLSAWHFKDAMVPACYCYSYDYKGSMRGAIVQVDSTGECSFLSPSPCLSVCLWKTFQESGEEDKKIGMLQLAD